MKWVEINIHRQIKMWNEKEPKKKPEDGDRITNRPELLPSNQWIMGKNFAFVLYPIRVDSIYITCTPSTCHCTHSVDLTPFSNRIQQFGYICAINFIIIILFYCSLGVRLHSSNPFTFAHKIFLSASSSNGSAIAVGLSFNLRHWDRCKIIIINITGIQSKRWVSFDMKCVRPSIHLCVCVRIFSFSE